MAKNSITDYSKTAASNTDIQSVDIAEGCLPSGINNAIREIMADLADMNDGTVTLTSPSFAAASLTGDLSFGDNDKAIFGAGSDLQIYHDGSDSYVKDAGTGYLNLLGTGRVVVGHPSNGHVYLNANYGGDVELFFNNSKKLETTSTGIDVTGTVTADGLTVDTNTLHVDSTNNRVGIGTSSPAKDLHIVGGDFSGLRIVHETDGTTFNLQSDSSGNTQLNATTATDITFLTNNFERMRIDSSGNVGIGTSLTASSSAVKTLFSNTSGGTYIQTNSGSNGGLVLGTDGGGAGVFFTYTGAVGSESYSERMRIDSSGNVGIGTSDVKGTLHAKNTSDNATLSSVAESIVLSHQSGSYTSGNYYNVLGFAKANSNGGTLGASIAPTMDGSGQTTALTFGVASGGGSVAERLRIDSSGNVLVGKTATDSTTAGVDLRPEGVGVFVRDGNRPLIANRLTDDGDLIQFRKDGTTVGSIGIESAYGFYIDGESGHTGCQFAANNIIPRDNGSRTDNSTDLGSASFRFNDLYLGGGVYVGGTGSANHLDDYEEGTWTPAFQFLSTPTYTTQEGHYVKIGRLVHCKFAVVVSSLDTNDASQVHLNLPFAAEGGSPEGVSGSVDNYSNTLTTNPATIGNVSGDNDTVRFNREGSFDRIKYQNCNSSGLIRGAFTYYTQA